MITLTKKQDNLYKKLCSQHNEHYSGIVSFDNYMKGQVNKAYYSIKDEAGKTREHYENIKAIQLYAENDF